MIARSTIPEGFSKQSATVRLGDAPCVPRFISCCRAPPKSHFSISAVLAPMIPMLTATEHMAAHTLQGSWRYVRFWTMFGRYNRV